VRSHNAVRVVLVFFDLIQKPNRKPTLTVITVYHQLCDPTYLLSIYFPPACENIASEVTVDSDSDIGRDTGKKIVVVELLRAQLNASA
jgi:hypothetical protein